MTFLLDIPTPAAVHATISRACHINTTHTHRDDDPMNVTIHFPVTVLDAATSHEEDLLQPPLSERRNLGQDLRAAAVSAELLVSKPAATAEDDLLISF